MNNPTQRFISCRNNACYCSVAGKFEHQKKYYVNVCKQETSLKKRQIFVKICWQSENSDSDLKVHALHYANELLVRIKNFCKRAKPRAEKMRNYQKQVLVMIKHCLGKSQINSIRSKEFSSITFLQRTNTKVSRTTSASKY